MTLSPTEAEYVAACEAMKKSCLTCSSTGLDESATSEIRDANVGKVKGNASRWPHQDNFYKEARRSESFLFFFFAADGDLEGNSQVQQQQLECSP